MRVGAYIRVSTQDQSTEVQKRGLTEYVTARGWTETTFYEDKASGTDTQRVQLQKLLNDARARKVDVIVVWKLDRFARSLRDLVVTLHEVTELGVDFISIKDNIDLTTSAGRLMLHLLGAFAQFEADLIKSRVIAGLANAKAKGVKLGRKPSIDVSAVVALRRQGLSLSAIAKRLGISKAGVHKTLANFAITNPSINPEIIASTNAGVGGQKPTVKKTGGGT